MDEIKVGDVVVLKSDFEQKMRLTVHKVVEREKIAHVYYTYIDPTSGKITIIDNNGLPVTVLKKIENQNKL